MHTKMAIVDSARTLPPFAAQRVYLCAPPHAVCRRGRWWVKKNRLRCEHRQGRAAPLCIGRRHFGWRDTQEGTRDSQRDSGFTKRFHVQDLAAPGLGRVHLDVNHGTLGIVSARSVRGTCVRWTRPHSPLHSRRVPKVRTSRRISGSASPMRIPRTAARLDAGAVAGSVAQLHPPDRTRVHAHKDGDSGLGSDSPKCRCGGTGGSGLD
jgi:hypothetical protein